MISITKWSKRCLDFILPYTCLGCGGLDCEQDTLCSTCYKELHILSGPFCHKCGHPTREWNNSESTCVYCPFPFSVDATRCCVAYNDLARSLVLRFKNGDGLAIARFWGEFMKRSSFFQDIWNVETDWIVAPVPMHWWRLWLRGFNQAAELGRHCLPPQSSSITWVPDLLKSSRWGTTQKSQKAFLRLQQKSPFSLNPRYNIESKAILLLDDVITTGVTVHHCAEILKAAGAKYVAVGAIARTLRPNWQYGYRYQQ